jgi:hypothetical protein
VADLFHVRRKGGREPKIVDHSNVAHLCFPSMETGKEIGSAVSRDRKFSSFAFEL